MSTQTPRTLGDAREALADAERRGDIRAIAKAQSIFSDALCRLADHAKAVSERRGLLEDAAKYSLAAAGLYNETGQGSHFAAACMDSSAIHAYLATLEEDNGKRQTFITQAEALCGYAIRAAEAVRDHRKIGVAHTNAVIIYRMMVEVTEGQERERVLTALQEHATSAVTNFQNAYQLRQQAVDYTHASRLFWLLAHAENDQGKRNKLIEGQREAQRLAYESLRRAGSPQSSSLRIEPTTDAARPAPTETSERTRRVGPSNFCEGCGQPLPADQSFCASCGHRQQVATISFCEGCGEQLETGSAYCPSCGRKQPVP